MWGGRHDHTHNGRSSDHRSVRSGYRGYLRSSSPQPLYPHHVRMSDRGTKRSRTVRGGVSSRDRRGNLTWRRTKRTSGRKARNALVRVPRNKIGFPQSMRTELRYCDAIDFTPNSSTIGLNTFLANGLYDPDGSLGGHQPRGFDEFMEVYKKFTVKGSKISVTWTYEGYNGPSQYMSTGAPQQSIQAASGAVQAVPATVGMIIPSAEASVSGTVTQSQEIEKARWCTITPTGESKTISASVHTSDFFGKDFLVGADGYTGDTSADPSNKVYYHVCAGLQHDEYPVTIKLRANVCITYDVTFTEPKFLPVS